jgi:hypothetical protein
MLFLHKAIMYKPSENTNRQMNMHYDELYPSGYPTVQMIQPISPQCQFIYAGMHNRNINGTLISIFDKCFHASTGSNGSRSTQTIIFMLYDGQPVMLHNGHNGLERLRVLYNARLSKMEMPI